MASTDMIKTVMNAFKVRFSTLTTKISKLEDDLKINAVQGNWNQNDSKDPEYIKNRPFYDDASGESVKIPERFIPIANSDSIGGVKANPNLDSNVPYDDVMIDNNGAVKSKPYFISKYENSYPKTKLQWEDIYDLVVNKKMLVRVGFENTDDPISSYHIDISYMYKYSGTKVSGYYGSGYGVMHNKKLYYGTNIATMCYFNVRWENSNFNTDKATYIKAQSMSLPAYGDMMTGIFGSVSNPDFKTNCYLRVIGNLTEWTDEILVPSSTTDSTKKFRITVDDTGIPTFTDTSKPSNSYKVRSTPYVNLNDVGKFLRVSSDGKWAAESIPITDGIVVKSSTPDSTKQFKITVDDSGTLTATEVT